MDEELGKCLPVHLIAILIKQNGATKKIVSSKTLRIVVCILVVFVHYFEKNLKSCNKNGNVWTIKIASIGTRSK